MIRYIYCVRKKQDISLEEFRSYCSSTEYRDIIKKIANYYQAIRYTLSSTLKVEMGEILIKDNGLSTPYDATFELFWDNANNLRDLYLNEKAQELSDQLHEYQSTFVDPSRSTAFFTMEENPD